MDTHLDTTVNYQAKLDNAIRLTSVINEVIAGKSLAEACQAADIREEAVKGFFAMPVRTKNAKNDAMPDWRSDFMKEIYGDGSTVLSDFNECYDYFKSTLTTEQAKVLVGKFEKKMTFSALGQEMGVSSARIHKLIDELKDMLHQKNMAEMFQLGGEYIALIRELEMAKFTREQTIARLKDELTRLDAETRGIEESIEMSKMIRSRPSDDTDRDRDDTPSLSDIHISSIQAGEYLPLTIDCRTATVCRRCGIHTVKDLYDAGGRKIAMARNAGKKVLDNCMQILDYFGLSGKEWKLR